MRVSVELIPRNVEDFEAQLDDLAQLPFVDTVNVPDLLRFPLRSWDACRQVRARGLRAVPHLRSIDVDPNGPLPFLDALDEAGLQEVLIVSGDAPADMRQTVFDTDPVALVKRLAAVRPDVRTYVALDPYRQGFLAERAYLQRKLEAGAVGVFTQPFFDVRLAEVWGELLEPLQVPVFWGATSVTSSRSARYWTSRNRAVLPAGFQPTLQHARETAEALAAFARARDESIYFMPIRLAASRYLSDLPSLRGIVVQAS